MAELPNFIVLRKAKESKTKVTYELVNTKTNADRIRSMSDEELVQLFADGNCGYCRIHDFCYAKGCQVDCEDMWLKWLKEEAEGWE